MLTQAWVNDAAYFDGTGFAEISITDESARIQRFEQEVKLLSHKGILLLLQNRVKTPLIRLLLHSYLYVISYWIIDAQQHSQYPVTILTWPSFNHSVN